MPAPARRKTDYKGIVGWLLRPAPRVYVGVLFLGLCVLFGLFALGYEQRGAELRRDERNTCLIQRRGLPANKHLAAAMGDIAYLLSLPRPPSAPIIPAPVETRITGLVADSSAYAAVQAKQPKTRECP